MIDVFCELPATEGSSQKIHFKNESSPCAINSQLLTHAQLQHEILQCRQNSWSKKLGEYKFDKYSVHVVYFKPPKSLSNW
jgi:hypothetical protein